MATATPNSQAAASESQGGGPNSNSRFMFVEFSAPTEPPKGTKKRRGGPSEVRAHITKEYHRRLRDKRLGAPKTVKDAEFNLDGKDEEEHISRPERTRSVSNSQPDPTTPLDGEEEGKKRHEMRHSSKPPRIRRASSTSWQSDPTASTTTPLTQHSEISRSLSRSPSLQSMLGESRLDPFDALPSLGTMPVFIDQVLKHGRSPPPSLPSHAKMLGSLQLASSKCLPPRKKTQADRLLSYLLQL